MMLVAAVATAAIIAACIIVVVPVIAAVVAIIRRGDIIAAIRPVAPTPACVAGQQDGQNNDANQKTDGPRVHHITPQLFAAHMLEPS